MPVGFRHYYIKSASIMRFEECLNQLSDHISIPGLAVSAGERQ
jgi:hypothetical protein